MYSGLVWTKPYERVSVSLLAIVGGFFCGPALAQQADVGGGIDLRPFFIQPRVGVQESFTDNALLTEADTRTDFVTRAVLGANVTINSGPATGSLLSQVSYDQYASNSALSGWSLFATGSGTYDLVPDFLALEGEGSVTNGTVSTFGTSAIDRTGTAGRVQLATYDIGPHMRTTVDDFADLNVQGRFAQVIYTAADHSQVANLPSDSNIGQVGTTLDTGTRYAGYELLSAGNYEQDDHGFLLYNAIQSVYVRIAPQFRLIGRGGYEDISQPGIVNISDGIWSGGVEASINERSKITVETGERYGHSIWNADAYLQFSDRIFGIARYSEVLEPAQVAVNASFSDFITMSRLLPVPLVPANYTINGNLYSQTTLDKNAEVRLGYTEESDTVTLYTSWIDQRFQLTGAHDRELLASLQYTRHIRPDLTGEFRFNFAHTYASPLFGASQSYGGEVDLAYDLNSTMVLKGGYDLERQASYQPNPAKLAENVVFVSVEKRF
jgi:uncharacterized protein (PEP-CTERM system associated)